MTNLSFLFNKNNLKRLICKVVVGLLLFSFFSGNVLADDYELSVDVWLIFSVDQDVITPETTLLTGTLMKHEDTIIRVRVNNVKIAEKRIAENDDTFSIETDFSNYNIGDEVVISREYAGVNNSESNVKIWNQQVSYRITDANNSNATSYPTITPSPTPEISVPPSLEEKQAVVKSKKNVTYYKTASTKKIAGKFKNITKLSAVAMQKGFVEFLRKNKSYYIKVSDVKIKGKFEAELVKKAKIYNSKFKATKKSLSKRKKIVISDIKVKNKVAYLNYAKNKYIKATNVAVITFDERATVKDLTKVYIDGKAIDCDNLSGFFTYRPALPPPYDDTITIEAKLPFIHIMKALGAKIIWKTNSIANVRLDNKTYILNLNESALDRASLKEKGKSEDFFDFIAGGMCETILYKECVVEKNRFSKFLREFGLTIKSSVTDNKIEIVKI